MQNNKGSRTAKVRKLIGDDYYDLKLGFDQLVELQELTDRGPIFIANQLVATDPMTGQAVGNWSPTWVYHTIRLGLIGSEEMKPREAVQFCDRHLREGFIYDYADAAADVIYTAMAGRSDDPIPEDEVTTPGEQNPKMDPLTPSDASNGEATTDWQGLSD